MTSPPPGASTRASPHTRGWTLRLSVLGGGEGGFPAHAGMDPGDRCRSTRRARLPRTRGDGPVAARIRIATVSASPHTRGWTRGPDHHGSDAAGFPAHAGMDPGAPPRPAARRWLPRTRGDGPGAAWPPARETPASPHTRGWTRRRDETGRAPGGFPAHAGMDPRRYRPPPGSGRLPRTRGDGPWIIQEFLFARPASPHTRGWTRGRAPGAEPERGFPAHAGMDRRRPRRADGTRRLPRTRGDGPRLQGTTTAAATASPHTRGWTPRSILLGDRQVGFPAHAGMDPCSPAAASRRRRLPRTRGDGPCVARLPGGSWRASPHTRGWTRERRLQRRQPAGFPAHAGMDPCARPAPPGSGRLPRTRGDGPAFATPRTFVGSASPHTRGWTRGSRRRAGYAVGFPAHAGMDPGSSRSEFPDRRLPRTRGDGPRMRLVMRPWQAASPHTRGWTLGDLPAVPPDRGFPAHAGMDPRPRRTAPAAAPAPAGFPAHAGMDPRPIAR